MQNEKEIVQNEEKNKKKNLHASDPTRYNQ